MKGGLNVGFNMFLYYGIKILLPILFAYAYMKYKRAKSIDNTLELKLKGRSKIEFYLSILLSIAYIAYPVSKSMQGTAVFIGSLIFLYAYLVLERLVAVGRKVIFAKFLAFEVRMINEYGYRNGRFEFFIRGGRIKVLLPIADVQHLQEMLSGSRRKSRGRRL